MKAGIRSSRRYLAGILVLTAIIACGDYHPSDAELMHRLEADRPAYDSLRAMALADSALWRVAPEWYRVRSGENRDSASAALLPARWQTYRRLFSRLGLKNGISIDSGAVYFLVSDHGIVGSGSSKGLAFLPRPADATPRCASLDSFPPATGSGHGICYRSIGNGWFISLDW